MLVCGTDQGRQRVAEATGTYDAVDLNQYVFHGPPAQLSDAWGEAAGRWHDRVTTSSRADESGMLAWPRPTRREAIARARAGYERAFRTWALRTWYVQDPHGIQGVLARRVAEGDELAAEARRLFRCFSFPDRQC